MYAEGKIILATKSIVYAKSLNVTLHRSKRKDDFGIVLGCKIYIKEIISRTIADKDGILKEGDELTKINGSTLESFSLKEARKLLEATKDKLDVTVKRSGVDLKSAAMRNGKLNNLNKGFDPYNGPPRPPLPYLPQFVLQLQHPLSPLHSASASSKLTDIMTIAISAKIAAR